MVKKFYGILLQQMIGNPRKMIVLGIAILLVLSTTPELYLYPWYLIKIKPHGEAKIEKIVDEVSQLNNTYEKLEKIARWEVKDFLYVYKVSPDYALDILPNLTSKLLFNKSYWRHGVYISDTGPTYRIRAVNSLFSNDPYWIAYYKVGGCGELAHLFVEVCKRAGIEARVVGTKGEDHFWVEVKIDGEWKHVDPTVYYWSIRGNENQKRYYSGKWFDNPRGYEGIGNIGWFSKYGISRVVAIDRSGNELEDVTKRYTDVGKLIVISKIKIDRIAIFTWKGDTKTTVGIFEDVNSSTFEIELGGKDYEIVAEKDVIPWLIVKRDSKNITLIEGKTSNLELDPQNIAPTDILISIAILSLSIMSGLLIVRGSKMLYEYLIKRRGNRK
jgi:hypothetical protein